jgi:hypothetical protein
MRCNTRQLFFRSSRSFWTGTRKGRFSFQDRNNSKMVRNVVESLAGRLGILSLPLLELLGSEQTEPFKPVGERLASRAGKARMP